MNEGGFGRVRLGGDLVVAFAIRTNGFAKRWFQPAWTKENRGTPHCLHKRNACSSPLSLSCFERRDVNHQTAPDPAHYFDSHPAAQ